MKSTIETMHIKDIKTLKDMHDANLTVSELMMLANQREPYPVKPTRPKMSSTMPSADEAREYAEKLAEYEALDEAYKSEMAERSKESSRIQQLVEQAIKEETGLNDIPEQYREKVYSYAYNHSHSSGMYEVYCTLLDLVKIFE